MSQIFHRSANAFSRFSIFGSVFLIAGVAYVSTEVNRSPYFTRANVVREQPVPFSHQHHSGQLGIDCRYCHTSVEDGAFAGIPPTKTCMTCHSQIWTNAEMLEPVRESYRSGKPIEWTRVHDLPDFAYFNHSIHVDNGIACESCHGRVDDMPLMYQENTLHMEWCLDCHRNPEKHVRPREAVFQFGWQAPEQDRAAYGEKLVEEYKIRSLTDCYTCHR